MLSMKDNAYRIRPGDWDLFIQSFDGFDCDKMCHKYFPNSKTLDLFQNPSSSLVYCRWCAQGKSDRKTSQWSAK